MKYTIGNTVDVKTSKAGKEYKRFNIKSESDVITKDVVAFPFFTGYNAIVAGAVIEAVLQDKEFNGQKSYSLVDGNLGAKPWANKSGEKTQAIAQAQEKKSEMITKAQDSKEESIKISSTARDATLIVTSQYKDLSEQDIKVKWIMWRKWLLNNWEPNNPATTSHGDPVPTFEQPEKDIINADDIPF